MPSQVLDLRPVLQMGEHDFGVLLGKVLSASRPLQSEEFLRGREQQLGGIKEALYQGGRHVLIHGFRGVGKSSLAQTAAFSLSQGIDPIIMGCDKESSFGTVIKDVFDEVTTRNPAVVKTIRERGISFGKFGIGHDKKDKVEVGRVSPPGSVNEAVRLVQFICESYHANPVIVIDEFDQIKDVAEQENFTNFIKQISDKHVSARFIFCGIGESVTAI